VVSFTFYSPLAAIEFWRRLGFNVRQFAEAFKRNGMKTLDFRSFSWG
jgi:hypothetical protein